MTQLLLNPVEERVYLQTIGVGPAPGRDGEGSVSNRYLFAGYQSLFVTGIETKFQSRIT